MTPVSAQSMDSAADYVHMIDYDTGTVLLSKQPDDPLTPASMAKLMTLEVVFEAIRERRVGLDDEFFVSENAWRTGGAPSRTATMFANVNSNVTLDNLLRGIMVQAANDACIVIAEGIAGSEEAFAVVMNERAREIGLTNSNFTNSTGLPEPAGQRMSMRDLVTLSQHLVREHHRLYGMFAEPEFTWNNIRQTNRNPIIAQGIGADGLMPGFAEDTGYGMVASAVMDGQRIILAIHGLPSANARLAEAQKLFAWGFRAFEKVRLFAADETVGEVGVFGGERGRVALTSAEPIEVLVPRGTRTSLRARIVYTGPIKAPVADGDPVGVLRIQNEDTVISEAALRAADAVDVGPLHRRALDAAWELAVGLVHSGVEAATSR